MTWAPNRFLAAALLVLATSGCAGLPMGGDTDGAALRALSASETADAQAARYGLQEAQRQAPGDPRTLLAAARFQEKAGRPLLAREYYQAVLLHRRPVPMPPPVQGERLRSPEALASMALRRLDGNKPDADKVVASLPPASKIETPPPAVHAKPQMAALQLPKLAADPLEDDPVIERFRAFTWWMASGLVTPDEFAARRYPNLGALLSYAEPPPALDLYAGLPDLDEVESRLRQGVGGKARVALLDSLMPANPKTRTAALDRKPKALDDAQARIDALVRTGLVTRAEYEREIAAIERLRRKSSSADRGGRR